MSTDTITSDHTRRPGRPRDAEIDDRVLQSALELLRNRPVGEEFTLAELVEHSGVSRAAIYRRWDGLQAILVAALDYKRHPVGAVERDTLFETLVATYTSALREVAGPNRSLINLRIILGLKDPELQHVYWERHVHRRRQPILEILTRAQEDGIVRPDIDLEATMDLMNGATYYQMTVRGDAGTTESEERITEAIRIVWNGITAT